MTGLRVSGNCASKIRAGKTGNKAVCMLVEPVGQGKLRR